MIVQCANNSSTGKGNVFKILTQNRKWLQQLHILHQEGAQRRAKSSSLKIKVNKPLGYLCAHQ